MSWQTDRQTDRQTETDRETDRRLIDWLMWLDAVTPLKSHLSPLQLLCCLLNLPRPTLMFPSRNQFKNQLSDLSYAKEFACDSTTQNKHILPLNSLTDTSVSNKCQNIKRCAWTTEKLLLFEQRVLRHKYCLVCYLETYRPKRVGT